MSETTFREQSLFSSSQNCIYSMHTKLHIRFLHKKRDGFRNGGLYTAQPNDAALTREYFIELCRRETWNYVKQIYICIGAVLSLNELMNTARLE